MKKKILEDEPNDCVCHKRDAMGESVCLGSATTVMSILTHLAYGYGATMCVSVCTSRAHTHTHKRARKCALTHSGITFLSLNPWTAGRARFPKCWKICSAKEHTLTFRWHRSHTRWNAIHTTVADIIKWSHVCYTSAIESLSCAVHTAYRIVVVVPLYLFPLVCAANAHFYTNIFIPTNTTIRVHHSVENVLHSLCILSATGHTSHIGIRSIRRVAKSKENRICLLRANDANTTTMSNDDNLPLINSTHTACHLCAHSIHIRFYRFVFKQL